jgi:hypothetical protein
LALGVALVAGLAIAVAEGVVALFLALCVLIGAVFLPATVLRMARNFLCLFYLVREEGQTGPSPAGRTRREVFVAVLMAIAAVYLVIWTHRQNLEMAYPARQWGEYTIPARRDWANTVFFYTMHLLAVTTFLALPISRFIWDYVGGPPTLDSVDAGKNPIAKSEAATGVDVISETSWKMPVDPDEAHRQISAAAPRVGLKFDSVRKLDGSSGFLFRGKVVRHNMYKLMVVLTPNGTGTDVSFAVQIQGMVKISSYTRKLFEDVQKPLLAELQRAN